MVPTLKVAFALLSLLQLSAPSPVTTASPKLKLSEITHLVQKLNSGVQVPCNDTRVAQVAFTDRKVKDAEQELLCQAATTLAKVTRCRTTYQPLITNLKSLHGRTTCSLSNENEIYLRHFLPQLGNFTQGMYRRLATSAA
ncbi:hypothetical protein M959_03909, partial [Chaetura pelagica]